ncbi:MAG: tetratricopeptide repeat protein [Acidobacteria bacterium]|nr:tetratricopeptide repeat protein [Acidobacteriota bacterium]
MLCLLLLLAILAAYTPAIHNGFVNFDDEPYITRNPHIAQGLTGQTVKWAFSQYYEANWHPLTWLSHALDVQLFQLNPGGHHAMNVLLHGVNAILLFLLLQYATGFTWRSLAVAALFALHPINVESVAWAAERKNVLSMLFLLLAMLAYTWYARRPGWLRYLLVFAGFALGLMSKPQIITLPFLLLLWDYWPLRRTGHASGMAGDFPATQRTNVALLILEKVPLFALSLASALVTMQAQKAGNALRSTVHYGFGLRAANALVAYCRYLGKAFWPTELSAFYPYPLDGLRPWQVAASGLLLLLITALVMWRRRQGYLVTGWFCFLGTMVPMIGLVQVGEQAMADRYAYLPLLGIFLLVCWGIAEWAEARHIPGFALAIAALLALAGLTGLTYRQVGYWKNSETLWVHALQVDGRQAYKAHFNLAVIYDQEGRYDEAIAQFRQSVNPRAEDPRVHLGLGIYYQRHGHPQDAIVEYDRVLGLSSDAKLRAPAYSNLAAAYRQLHQDDQAKANFTAALQLNPDLIMARIGRGLLAQKSGDYRQAIEDYSHAMELQPTALGYLLLARAEEQAGQRTQAQAARARAQQIEPDLAAAEKAAGELMAF